MGDTQVICTGSTIQKRNRYDPSFKNSREKSRFLLTLSVTFQFPLEDFFKQVCQPYAEGVTSFVDNDSSAKVDHRDC